MLDKNVILNKLFSFKTRVNELINHNNTKYIEGVNDGRLEIISKLLDSIGSGEFDIKEKADVR